MRQPNGVHGRLPSVTVDQDAQVQLAVTGNGYIDVPYATCLNDPSFDVRFVATSERDWTRTHGIAQDGIIALGGPPQVIRSDDDVDYERADCRILDYRICLTRAIVECL